MSTAEEQDLRLRLHDALDTLPDSLPPASAVTGQGRRLRWQRRAGVAVALAVAVAGVVAAAPGVVPALRAAPASPGQPERHHITVSRPRPGAPGGEIARGNVDGFAWQVRLDSLASSLQAVMTGPDDYTNEVPVQPFSPGGFAELGSSSDGSGMVLLVGAVAPAVTRLTMSVPGSGVLTLRPVAYRGGRYVAVALPAVRVAGVAAFGRRGELGHAIPYDRDPAAGPVFLSWLPPGQSGPRPVSVQVSAAVYAGLPGESVTVSSGPWGICDAGADLATDCLGPWPPAGGQLRDGKIAAVELDCTNDDHGHAVVVMAVAPGIRSLRVQAGGQVLRPPLDRVGAAAKVFAVVLPKRSPPLGWKVFDAIGQLVYAGSC